MASVPAAALMLLAMLCVSTFHVAEARSLSSSKVGVNVTTAHPSPLTHKPPPSPPKATPSSPLLKVVASITPPPPKAQKPPHPPAKKPSPPLFKKTVSLKSPPSPPNPPLNPTPPNKNPSPPPWPPGQPILGGGKLAKTMPATGLMVPGGLNPKGRPFNEKYLGAQIVNPQINSSYVVLTQQTGVTGVHLIHIPGTNAYLYMERPSGYHPIMKPAVPANLIAGVLDLDTMIWRGITSPDSLFCAGHTVSATGEVVIYGGHRMNAGYASGLMSIRIYNHSAPLSSTGLGKLINTTTLSWGRWYPTGTLLASNNIIIMGGTQNVGAGTGYNPSYEIFNPRNPTQHPLPQFSLDPAYLAATRQDYYPFNYVLPTKDLFNFCNRVGKILIPETGVYRNLIVPTRPGSYQSQYPYTATSVMLALRPENDHMAEVMIFGGALSTAVSHITTVASQLSHRLTLTWSNEAPDGSWSYDFGDGWVQEDMGVPRVMGDAVLLPNGDVILMNGAQTGVAGDSASGGDSRADNPNLWAQLYQPDLPLGQRYTMLAASTIGRMYHSTTSLTIDGTILVAGCDRCGHIASDAPWIVRPAHKAEYRNEIFYPPYFYDVVNKPSILTINGDTNPKHIPKMGYNEAFMVSWASAGSSELVPVTSVSLVSASSCTHSFNQNQRVVFLNMTTIDNTNGVVQLLTPPTPWVAVPQMYMVFLMNGKTYSSARWIQLVDKAGVAQ